MYQGQSVMVHQWWIYHDSAMGTGESNRLVCVLCYRFQYVYRLTHTALALHTVAWGFIQIVVCSLDGTRRMDMLSTCVLL